MHCIVPGCANVVLSTGWICEECKEKYANGGGLAEWPAWLRELKNIEYNNRYYENTRRKAGVSLVPIDGYDPDCQLTPDAPLHTRRDCECDCMPTAPYADDAANAVYRKACDL